MVLNLKSDMREDYSSIIVPTEPPRYIPNPIEFPVDILLEVSEYNDFHQELGTKLYGRQLAGHIKRLAASLKQTNVTAVKAGSKKLLGKGITPILYTQMTIRKGGDNLQTELAESIGIFTDTLDRATKVEKMSLPPLWDITLTKLAQAGLFTAPPGEDKLSAKMWLLPDSLLEAMKIKKRLPPPYTQEKRDTIEALDKAIDILHKLYPFVSQLNNWVCTEQNGKFVEYTEEEKHSKRVAL